jgi:ABC-type transport system involved in cytochrome bd biosynthesis fused ATPase/permease subunit
MEISPPGQPLNRLVKDIDILQELFGTSFDPFVYYWKGTFVKMKLKYFAWERMDFNLITCSEGILLFVFA